MVRVIKQTEPIARKEYYCDLGEDVGEMYWPKGMTFTELRSLVNYDRKKRKILKGERYVNQFNEYDGDVYQFKMDESIFKIFCKYELFREV